MAERNTYDGTPNSDGWYLSLGWSVTSENRFVQPTTTTVYVTLTLKNDNSSAYFWMNSVLSGSLSVGGQVFSYFMPQRDYYGNTNTLLASAFIDLNHASDGTLTGVNFIANCQSDSENFSHISVTGVDDLPTVIHGSGSVNIGCIDFYPSDCHISNIGSQGFSYQRETGFNETSGTPSQFIIYNGYAGVMAFPSEYNDTAIPKNKILFLDYSDCIQVGRGIRTSTTRNSSTGLISSAYEKISGTLDNSKKSEICAISFQGNTNYKVIIYNYLRQQNIITNTSGTLNLISTYDSICPPSPEFGIDHVRQYAPSTGAFGDPALVVRTLPVPFTSGVVSETSIELFSKLKSGITGKCYFSAIIQNEAGISNGTAVNPNLMRCYARYRYKGEIAWTEWQEASDLFTSSSDIANGKVHECSINIVSKRGKTIEIQVSYGTVNEEYASELYEQYYFISEPYTLEFDTSVEEITPGTLQNADYSIEIWKNSTDGSDYHFLVDISHIAVSDLVIRKERNVPEELSVDIEYIQFKKKIEAEGLSSTDIIKPYLVDIIVKRNFEVVFSGVLMYSRLTLSAVHSQTLHLEAMGFIEELSKRYINCSFGDMNYPMIAQEILKASQHEMNWIDNYDFHSDDQDLHTGTSTPGGQYTMNYVTDSSTAYANGWFNNAKRTYTNSYMSYEYDSNSIPSFYAGQLSGYGGGYEELVPVPDTSGDVGMIYPGNFISHWNNKSISWDPYTTLYCYKFYCSEFVGSGLTSGVQGEHQYLHVSFWVNPTLFFGYRPNENYCTLTFRFGLTTNEKLDGFVNAWGTNENGLEWTRSVTFYRKATNNPEDIWQKVEFEVDCGSLKGQPREIWFENTSNFPFGVCDFDVYRPSNHSNELNPVVKRYNLGFRTKVFDSHFFDSKAFPKDRIRHYYKISCKEAIYNLSKLISQNFEYSVDRDRGVNFVQAQGNLIADKVATWPGEIREISVERDASVLYNVGYSVDATYDHTAAEFLYNTETPPKYCFAQKDSCETYSPRVAITTVDSKNAGEIEEETKGLIHATDEVQDVPILTFDSNIYNPGNVQVGDAFGLQLEVDDNFSFVNGQYRVYGYTLTLTQDHVEDMQIDLVPFTALQMQLMTFPKSMKNMMNNIRRIQLKAKQ